MEITICSGSSCYQKGSEKLIRFLQNYIEQNNLEKKVLLKATFCLGNCSSGLNVKFNKKIITFSSVDEGIQFFKNIIK